MPLIPIDLPPGLYRNGTEYQANGRWRDANLIRWHEGALRPVGGWQQRGTVDINAVARGALSWRDNSGDRYVAFGSHSKLQVMSASNTVTDITPSGFTSGRVSAANNTGYGGGFYGAGLYGTARTDVSSSVLPATTWSLDNWGEYLVGCSTDDGKLYEWQLDTMAAASAISNAPTGCKALLVTEERFLFALGSGGNPRRIQWSDREDNTTWTPAATNEAGDYEIQTNGSIMRGIRTRGQSLILTDQDAHTATYQGPPFVYGFERVGSSCGLIAPLAVVAIDAGVIWMGNRAFYAYSGSLVNELPCDVADYVFSDINMAQKSKVNAVVNTRWGEIWWFYPSSASNECDRYVKFDYQQNIWDTGTLGRTSGVDAGVFNLPMWIDDGGVLYEHEVGFSYDGAAPFAETGPIALGAGDQLLSIVQMIPDEKTQGDVSATFKTRFYPNDTEYSYGPYSMANPTDVRFTGRQIRMRVTGNTNSDWRVGIMRLDARASGQR